MKIVARFLAIALTLSFSAPTSNAAIKSGASCPKIGINKIYAGKSYVCVKKGKKLIWDKGNKVLTTTPEPKTSTSPGTSAAPIATATAEAVSKYPAAPTSFDDLWESEMA